MLLTMDSDEALELAFTAVTVLPRQEQQEQSPNPDFLKVGQKEAPRGGHCARYGTILFLSGV
jgi:hypothetical protein